MFLIVNGLYLNTSIVACIDPYYVAGGAGGTTGTTRGSGRGGGRAGIVRVTLDARAIQPAYPGQGQPTLPLVFDITNSSEMAHARRLLASWGQTGIATGLTGTATAIAQSGGGGGEEGEEAETPAPTAVRRRGPAKATKTAPKTAAAGGGGS
jgi:hypothetical protein